MSSCMGASPFIIWYTMAPRQKISALVLHEAPWRTSWIYGDVVSLESFGKEENRGMGREWETYRRCIRTESPKSVRHAHLWSKSYRSRLEAAQFDVAVHLGASRSTEVDYMLPNQQVSLLERGGYRNTHSSLDGDP
jgi:hypothetical protein